MAKAIDFNALLKKYYAKRCVVKGGFTYENGLYFYAFDAKEEPKACKAGVSSPGPLVYDRTTRNTYFFPDGSPHTLAKTPKDGLPKGQMPLQKLKIDIVGKWKS